MEAQLTVQDLLRLRKVTRAVADLLRGQMKEYFATLSPLLRPKTVLGEYIQGGQQLAYASSSIRETVRGADKTFGELQALYATVASAKPFGLPKELTPPVEIVNTTMDVNTAEYVHEAKTDQESKKVVITSPLKWTLSYSGFPLSKLQELLAARNRNNDELKQFIVHYLVLHLVMAKQPGVTNILEALHFPVITEKRPAFGELPISCISATISTFRPADSVIIESTEISGMDAFEEIVNIDNIAQPRDPLKDRLFELVRSHGVPLLPQ